MRNCFYMALPVAFTFLFYSGCSSYQGALHVDAKPSTQNVIQSTEENASTKPMNSTNEILPEKQGDIGKNQSILPINELQEIQSDVFRFTETGHILSENPYYYYAAAQLLSKTGDFNQVGEYLIKSIESDPESSFLKQELVLHYLYQQDIPAALRIVEQHLEKTPDDLDMLVLYGRIQQNQKNIPEAQQTYEDVIEKDPERKNVYLILGRLYMDQKDLASAMNTYEKLIQHFPSYYVGHFFVGKIHAAQGDFKKAEQSFYRALEIEPTLEEPRFELLDIYHSQGNEKKIVQVYQQIIENNPNNLRAAMALGYFYYQNKKYKQADDIFGEMGKRSLTDPDVIRKIIQLYLDTNEYHEAVIILEGMLKGAPESSDIHYMAGIAYNGLKDAEMTTKHLKQVLPGSMFYADAIAHMSFILQEKEEFDKAITVLRQGLDVDPDNVNLRYRLGVVYDLGGLKSLSIEEMKTVIQLDPEHSSALNYLGYTYAELGENLEEAERLIKKALEFRPEDGFFTDSLGWVYFKKGLIDQAVVFLEKAVDLEPKDPVILEHLGDAYLKANDKVKALEFYNRSLLERKEDNANKVELEKKIQELTSKGPQDG